MKRNARMPRTAPSLRQSKSIGTAAAQAMASAATMLMRPSAARAPMPSSTGTAGTGNGTCSATTNAARMTYPRLARRAKRVCMPCTFSMRRPHSGFQAASNEMQPRRGARRPNGQEAL